MRLFVPLTRRLDLSKAKAKASSQQFDLFGGGGPPRPPGAGWQNIPAGKHGGFRRRKGTGYEYWYPGTGIQGHPHPGESEAVHAEHAAPEEAARARPEPLVSWREAPIEVEPPPSPAAPAAPPRKVSIVRINPETGKEEPVAPAAPKPSAAPAPPPKAEPKPVNKDSAGNPIDRETRYSVWERSPSGDWTMDRSYSGAWFLPGSGGEPDLTDPRKKVVPFGHSPILPEPKPAPPQPAAEPLKLEPAPKPAPGRKKAAKPAKEAPEEPGKYETTGYVFGSRAELWALRNSGELEKDPAIAYKLTTKKAVLGGEVEASSFAAEREAGTEPAAAFLKFKLMQAIQQRPEDSPEAREKFSAAIFMVQKSLAGARTQDDMRTFVRELEDQLRGVAPKEELTHAMLVERGWDAIFMDPPEGSRTSRPEEWRTYRQAHYEANSAILKHYDGHCNIRKIDNDHYVAMGPQVAAVHREMVQTLETLGPRFLAIIGYRVTYPQRRRAAQDSPFSHLWDKDRFRVEHVGHKSEVWQKVWQEESRIRAKTKLHEDYKAFLQTNPSETERAAAAVAADPWHWLEPAGAKSAETSATTRTDTAKAGESSATTRTDTEKGEDYHTILDQARLGESKRVGPLVPGNKGIGSHEMAKSLGLHEVEYGHWVGGEDQSERQWHTESAHAALYDLAHVLGIAPEQIGQRKEGEAKGRLTMAFGSRGSGRFAATYHPAEKVINITKIAGKGSLAHEWGHFLDYMIRHVSAEGSGKPGSTAAAVMGSGMGAAISPKVQAAMSQVMTTITRASASSEGRFESHRRIEQRKRDYYDKLRDSRAARTPGAETERSAALANEAEEIRLEISGMVKEHNAAVRGGGDFRPPTEFYASARKMGDYWQRPTELFARCFEAYVSDRLEEQGRQNTYLVCGAKPMEAHPGYYPSGDHRKNVNLAMDALMEALRKDDHFRKALPDWDAWFSAVVSGPRLTVPVG